MRIPVSSIVNHQLPTFVREEYPLFSQFLEQYYLSDQSEKITQNLDKDIDIDVVFNLRSSAVLKSSIDYVETTISVDSTEGFPDNYGLIQIDNEIILYKSKTDNQFLDCVRGFSGITKLDREYLEFSESELEQHTENSIVINLSILYLKEFAYKIKKRITPGFEDRELFSGVNSSNFVKNIKTFYTSKGSDESFKILFKALYGKDVDVIKPRDFLFRPSDAQYRVTKDLVVEAIEGNPYDLINTTVYQDASSFIKPAQGTVIEVSKIIRNNKNYYVLSLDYDFNRDVDSFGTVKSEFSIHPKTICTSKILKNSNYIDVDSTVGFPESGILTIDLEGGQSFTVEYKEKVLNQFLGCSGITFDIPEKTEIKLNDFIYGFNLSGSKVLLRVTGVLGDIDYIDQSYDYSPKELIKIKTLGNNSKDFKSNHWFFNVPVTYEIEKIELLNSIDFTYKITTIDSHNFVLGDTYTLYSSDGLDFFGDILKVNNKKSIEIKNSFPLNLQLKYNIRKNISKVSVNNSKYSYLNIFNSNIQNIYNDYDKNVYVSSPSLPNYLDSPLDIKEFSSVVPAGNYNNLTEITFSSPHKFYTGDLVVYKPANSLNAITQEESYYVYKVNENKIKLSKSLLSIADSVFVKFSGQILPGYESIIELIAFYDLNFNRLQIKPQNLLRKLESPKLLEQAEETEPGTIGIFINGVEISNYKSNDRLFYGGIEKVNIIDGGVDYNVINPPKIIVTDPIGTGASLVACVEGSLKKINIIDPGFDYLETPIISIVGGGGTGAQAIAELISFTHSIEFDSSDSVNTSQDTIEFDFDHKFRNNEKVIYKTSNLPAISGISTNSEYFVGVVNSKKIKLYNTLGDSSSGINTINLSSPGDGVHSLVSTEAKKKISEIKVINPGEGYKNKKVKVSGINTASDSIIILNHEYFSGEIITYLPINSTISGLSSSHSYYVTVIDKDNIKLSGISTIGDSNFNFINKKYINLTTGMSGTHYFNYPEIEVQISGRIGIATFSGQDFAAKLQPVFSGKIKSVIVEEKGHNYGTLEILNYHKKPSLNITPGENAQVTPVIFNGSITKVLINSPGNGYDQVPDLEIIPGGNKAVLTPIISNGRLVEVIIINGGENYTENTIINVVPKGTNIKLDPIIESRTVNLVQRLIDTNNISGDDGYILRSGNSLQYTHLYSPRSLRKAISRKIDNLNINDLNVDSTGRELSNNSVHSPIVGWAYDGNPIYGPYGYINGNSGPVKRLSSGYSLKSDSQLILENRPTNYTKGFFIEDYEFTENGDLDQFNGRFCITPEYPDGIYAYFLTTDDVIADSSSIFFNYFSPKFPYIIGPKFKNAPLEKIESFESIGNKLLRNTTPYNLINQNSTYEFIENPNKIKEQDIEIITTKSSFIEKIDVIKGGENYKVGDQIVLDQNNSAQVETVSGSPIISIGSSYIGFSNLEIIPFKNQYIGILTAPHNVNVSKKYKLNSKYEINKNIVATPFGVSLLLSSQVGPTTATGITTYFNVSGDLDFPLKENDILKIGNEKVKILNIDQKLSRIKVLRNQLGTVGTTTYITNTEIKEDSRKFVFNVGLSTTYNFKTNKEFYFVPAESIGIGTTLNSTLIISNPGLGETSITIPPRSIFIQNHNLNSGDVVVYDSKNNSPIEVSLTGIGTTTLPQNQDLFVTKIDNDLIGISTIKFGQNNFYFQSIGTGSTHSLSVIYSNRLVSEIFSSSAIVSTSSSTGLSINDKITVNIISGVQTSNSFYYNDFNRRICGNKKTIDQIDLVNNIIHITNHNFIKSEKIIYVSASAIGGLESNGIYYVIPLTKDSFKLSNSFYGSTLEFPEEIDFTSSGTGYFYSTNPKIEIVETQDIVFDVSDSSLSFTHQGEKKSAFKLKLFYDSNLLNEYNTYDLTLSGRVGVDTAAKYTLKTSNIPNKLYCKFLPINSNILPNVKKEIYTENGFEIVKTKSKYSGDYTIIGIGSTSFSYELDSYPELELYSKNTSKLTYFTNSKTATGPINSVKLFKKTKTNKLPKVLNINSKNGSGALLRPTSSTIGSIDKIKKLDIGFNYTTDYTIRPKINPPKIVKIDSLYHLESVGISTIGKNYSNFPNLILIDSQTRKKYDNVKLIYNENKIIIFENTNNIPNKNVEVIPTNNDNGFEIDELTYNTTTRIATVKLKAPFNSLEEYPFSVNELFYVENISVASTSKGYNSSSYSYNYFKVLSSTPNIGGIGATFTYSLSDYLEVGESPGTIDNFYTNGFVIPKKYLPTFDIKLSPNQLFINEDLITSSNVPGKIVEFDRENNIVKLSVLDDIKPGDIVYGKSSKNYFSVIEVYSVDGYIDISSNSITDKGWRQKTGFLNNSLQRIHDNNYYQYFSYDLRSEVDYSKWSDVVDSLNHTSGFKKFGNLLINSTHDNIGITTNQDLGTVEIVNDIQSIIDVNCYNDFDLVTENYFTIDNELRSNEVYLRSRRIQDYIESRGNKVLLIDDISDQFKPVEPEENIIIDSFNLNFIRFKKYVINISDKLDEKYGQSVLINLLHDNKEVSINQYALNDTIKELGYFDSEIENFDINLKFYPFETSNKIYSVNSFSFNISDSEVASGSLDVGNIVNISSNKILGIGTTTICSISTTSHSSKILLTFSDKINEKFYSDEINYIHNGSSIVYNSYGELNMGKTIGIGTYSLYYNGANINVDIHPYETVPYEVNVLPISISGIATTSGRVFLSGNILESSYIGIASTGVPAKSLIYSHNDNYTSGLHQITIKNTNNNQITSTEILGTLNITNQEVYSVEFADLNTRGELGEFEVEYSNINGSFEIYFTPYVDINYEVRIFSTLISKFRRSETLEL